MAPAKRRRTPAQEQRFVIAKLDDSTVLAGWCVPIKDRRLASKIGKFKPTTRKIVELSPAFATSGESDFVAMIGGNLSVRLVRSTR